MKKLHVPKKKSSALSNYSADHNTRRITLGIALVLLGVLVVINLLTMSGPYKAVPVQGADRIQSQ